MSGTSTAEPVTGAGLRDPLSSGWIVGAAAVPPLAWLVHIAAMPALVPLACDTGRTWPLHLTTLVTALAATLGLAASHRSRSRANHLRALRSTEPPEEPLDHPAAEVVERARTWGTVGVVQGWVFLVLILAEHVPVLVLAPCPP